MSQFDQQVVQLKDRAMEASIAADAASAEEAELMASIEARRTAIRAKYDAARDASEQALYELAATQPATAWSDQSTAKELYDFGSLLSGDCLSAGFLKGFVSSLLAEQTGLAMDRRNIFSSLTTERYPVPVPVPYVAVPYKVAPEALTASAAVLGPFLVAASEINAHAFIDVLDDGLNQYVSRQITYDTDSAMFEIDSREFASMEEVLVYMSKHVTFGVAQGQTDDRRRGDEDRW